MKAPRVELNNRKVVYKSDRWVEAVQRAVQVIRESSYNVLAEGRHAHVRTNESDLLLYNLT